MVNFSIVVALDEKNGIGKDGRLPWHLSADLKYFKELTSQTRFKDKRNVVIMGRKTWESLPERFRPLPNRINVVLTHDEGKIFPQDVLKARNFEEVFKILQSPAYKERFESVFVIGGAQIFQEAISLSSCKKIYATHILGDFQCNTFFPPFPKQFKKTKTTSPQKEGQNIYYFVEYSYQG